jgi:hypothetical protein
VKISSNSAHGNSYRRKLVESRTAERNRLQKLLETANIKLASVASDVFGVSGMAMLKASCAVMRRLKRWPNWQKSVCV